jgi:CHASE2 domain-containing sensor protein
MKKRYLRALFNVEFVLGAALALVLTAVFGVLASYVPEQDETSFLSPITDRIEFLNIEDVSLDAIFAIKNTQFADPRVVVVNIGEVAPAPDGKIAVLLHKLHAYGARAIGLDVFFDRLHFERFPPERAQEIEALAQALAEVPNVVLASGYDEESLATTIQPVPELGIPFERTAFANLTPDDDGVVRRFTPYRTLREGRQLALPVRLVEMYDAALAAPVLAMDEEPQVIAYTGTYDQFQTVPIDDVIEGDRYAEMMRDAIVLVGFVNEKGLVYLNDTHTTPMGRRTARTLEDGTTEMGIEGPDMAGVLIHANVVNMLLTGEVIRAVPVWGDWLIAFVFGYLSIALYRALRTRVASSRAVGYLITTMLIVESMLVFFLPIISYFFLDIKISYDILTSVVLLFIPCNAYVQSQRFKLLHRSVRRWTERNAPHSTALVHAFDDDNAFIANMRLQHAALRALAMASSLVMARRDAAGQPLPSAAALPDVEVWRALLPEIGEIFLDPRRADEQYFLRYLSGRKLLLLRDSALKHELLATQKQDFNEFVDNEEWEMLLPYVLRLHRETLAGYLGAWRIEQCETLGGTSGVEGESATATRLCLTEAPGLVAPIALAPFTIEAECKVHRQVERFHFSALALRQIDLAPVPVYAGEGVACEPVLAPGIAARLAAAFSVPGSAAATRHSAAVAAQDASTAEERARDASRHVVQGDHTP